MGLNLGQMVALATERYNHELIDGEDPMAPEEMGEIMMDGYRRPDTMLLKAALVNVLQRRGSGSGSTGVDFRHIRANRRNWDTEPDPGTELIHQFGDAAETCDSQLMQELREEYAGLVEDSGGPNKADEMALDFMDGELERCEVQVIQEPQEPVAVMKCSMDGCFVVRR